MDYPQLTQTTTYPQATITTNHGAITVALFEDIAPLAVKNFIEHATSGYYDGVIFHRVIQDFMIQGGDPTGTGSGGESIYGESFLDEFSDRAFHLQGALAMANAGPNTNGSQFFIVSASSFPAMFRSQMEEAGYPKEVIAAYEAKGGTPWLDYHHTVFGQVILGMDVVQDIEQAKTDIADRPLEDVVIESVSVQRNEQN
ncbi:MAG: peptidylprolyl isomerase [Aerococcus sp.]|nr:peptidylprolyl isomerase [Aerococcus sp.]